MSRKRFDKFDCSIAQSLDEIGDWWTMLILREAFLGVETFTGFLKSLGVARNILTDRLERLVASGILEKVQAREDIQRYRYRLTPKGHDLLPVLVSIMQWGDRWLRGEGKEPMTLLDKETGMPVRTIAVENAKGDRLDIAAIRIQPGAGASRATQKRFTAKEN